MRLVQTVNGVTTQYAVDRAAPLRPGSGQALPQVLMESKPGTQVAYLYGAGPVAQYDVDSGAWAYHHPDALVLTAYWLWCQAEQRPWVMVTQKRSEVWQCDLDMYTTNYNLSERGLDLVEDLFRRTLRKRKRRSRMITDVGNWSVCNCIPVEKIEYVASALLDIGSTERVSIYPNLLDQTPSDSSSTE